MTYRYHRTSTLVWDVVIFTAMGVVMLGVGCALLLLL